MENCQVPDEPWLRTIPVPMSLTPYLACATAVTARPDTPTEELVGLLTFHNVSGMPVLDEAGAMIGIVGEADVLGKRGATVREIMTSEVVSVSEATPIEQIAALMAQRKIKRVPVARDGALIGMVSRADIVRALAARA